MKGPSERRKRIALFVCLILLSVGLITAQSRIRAQTAFLKSLVFNALMPAQAVVNQGLAGVRNLWRGYLQLTQTQRENERLRQQVAQLQGQLHDYREVKLQHQRLQTLLGFRTLNFPRAIVAEVLSIDPSPWASAITLTKGAEHGVELQRAVLTSEGLVGHTLERTSKYATVLLLTDRRSAVDALVQRTRARGIVVGTSQPRVELRYVDVQEDIRVGDRIVSSGLGGLFPKGLLIGTVTAVSPQPHGLFHAIDVEPAVRLDKLEEVLILGS